ncbi:MAG: 4-hydroxybenzoate octaprenyltransferase [Spirochaetales bacterium]|nr:MAG: 4-hydroxybenzoate octaprenyltransferase [Spirochaetales bacterium]
MVFSGLLRQARLVGDAVMIRHTLFSLPFAVAAVLLETNGRPPAVKLLWICLAAIGGRNAANAINRIVDKNIDGRNPRTADRHLPSGTLGTAVLWIFALAMLVLLVVSAFMLNPLCAALLPVAGFMVFGYSYTKRFTWLCHWWLGATCAIATMGAFLGISGRFELRYFVLSGAVTLWVAGFDVIYALQDIEFDRREGLKSIPARFGAGGARIIAALSHAGAALGFVLVPVFWPMGPAYLVGAGIAVVMLAAEHIISRTGTERHIRIAAYGINEILPLVLLAGVAIDLYLV